MTIVDEDNFHRLRAAADADVVAAIERVVRIGSDADLHRINAISFATQHSLDEHRTVAALLHGTRLGLFELSWNVVCPTCSGVLTADSTLKTIDRDRYRCALCDSDCEPTLDDHVEVTFTVSPRLREIAGQAQDTLSHWDYLAQMYWSSGLAFPDDLSAILQTVILDAADVPASCKAVLSAQVSAGLIIAFDPVSHHSRRLRIIGEPTPNEQIVTMVLDGEHVVDDSLTLQPGPLTVMVDNRTERRTMPALWIAGPPLLELLARRVQFLSAKRLLSHQTFRDLFKTDVLNVAQRMKITSLTFMFTDLTGSAELYGSVGDLAAYELVRQHFEALTSIVAEETGAVVKTIGDAIMATFTTPVQAMIAALRFRDAMDALNQHLGQATIRLRVGLHEGSCLAVTLNDQQDYFGQTVNIASRVQNLATDASIVATSAAMDADAAAEVARAGLSVRQNSVRLKGIDQIHDIYEIA